MVIYTRIRVAVSKSGPCKSVQFGGQMHAHTGNLAQRARKRTIDVEIREWQEEWSREGGASRGKGFYQTVGVQMVLGRAPLRVGECSAAGGANNHYGSSAGAVTQTKRAWEMLSRLICSCLVQSVVTQSAVSGGAAVEFDARQGWPAVEGLGGHRQACEHARGAGVGEVVGPRAAQVEQPVNKGP